MMKSVLVLTGSEANEVKEDCGTEKFYRGMKSGI